MHYSARPTHPIYDHEDQFSLRKNTRSDTPRYCQGHVYRTGFLGERISLVPLVKYYLAQQQQGVLVVHIREDRVVLTAFAICSREIAKDPFFQGSDLQLPRESLEDAGLHVLRGVNTVVPDLAGFPSRDASYQVEHVMQQN